MGRLNLTLEGGEDYKIEFINVGTKDWRSGNIDGADDQGERERERERERELSLIHI